VLDVLVAGYEFHLDQLPLLQAALSVSWAPPKDAPQRLAEEDLLTGVLRDVLRRGVSQGELSGLTDVELVADLIVQAYLSNFRLAMFDDADIDALSARLTGQVDLILSGLKA
jgi:hypothetical protein